jgi:hypothetical protein
MAKRKSLSASSQRSVRLKHAAPRARSRRSEQSCRIVYFSVVTDFPLGLEPTLFARGQLGQSAKANSLIDSPCEMTKMLRSHPGFFVELGKPVEDFFRVCQIEQRDAVNQDVTDEV